MPRFAVFIRDPRFSGGEFVGLARVDCDGKDEDDACGQAVQTHGSTSTGTVTRDDVALCVRLRKRRSRPVVRTRGGSPL
jgi:hypothetical protein